jgi:hypothetical protein
MDLITLFSFWRGVTWRRYAFHIRDMLAHALAVRRFRRRKLEIFLVFQLGSRQILLVFIGEPKSQVYWGEPAGYLRKSLFKHCARFFKSALIEIELAGVIPGYRARRNFY